MTLPTCCQYHKPATGCRQGRDCPERTRRIQENDLRWSRGIGYESAMPHLCRSDESGPGPVQPAGHAVLIYAGTVLATALAAVAVFINT